MAQFVLGVLLLLLRQIRARQQILVDANGSFRFATATEQIAEREVHIGRFRVLPDDFNKGVNRLIRLLVEQKIQALEIAARQAARFRHQLIDIDPRGDPAQREEDRNTEQPPEFKFHTLVCVIGRRLLECQCCPAAVGRPRCWAEAAGAGMVVLARRFGADSGTRSG